MTKIKRMILVAAVAALSNASGGARADTLINFDSLSASATQSSIPNGYAGLNWSGFNVLCPGCANYGTTGYVYGLVSSPNEAVEVGGGGSFTSRKSAFGLVSLYLASAIDPTASVTITGYLNGVEKDMEVVSVSRYSATLISLNWSNINTVGIFSGANIPIVMDNVRIASVPGPRAGVGIFYLFAWGAMALARKTRRS